MLECRDARRFSRTLYLLGEDARIVALATHLADGDERVRMAAAGLPRRPRVYFEEWDAPPISAIRWVSELIGIAGGDNCFPELAAMPLRRDRVIADPMEFMRRAPALTDGLPEMHALIRRRLERPR